jgi:hypothetical protein
MALPLPEMQQWFPDWDGSDSEGSVRSTIDEVADHPTDGEAFTNLPLPAHYAKNLAIFQEVLCDRETVTLPVMRRDVIGGGARKLRRPRGKKGKRKFSSQQEAEGSGGGEGDRILITKPTASGMGSRMLHPVAYRGLPSISTITELAEALNVPDWKEITDALHRHRFWPVAEMALQRFRSTPLDADETVVNGRFTLLMATLGYALDLTCEDKAQRSFGIGGILARQEYAFRGRSDTPYVVQGRAAPSCVAHGGATTARNEGGCTRLESAMVLTCEFKTAQTFPYGRVWYHGSRGLQLLGSLWSGWLLNAYAPALLLSPQQFKLLLVRDSADISCACASADWKNEGILGLTVHQFPSGYESGKTSSREFLEMLVIILSATSAEELRHPTVDGTSAEGLRTPTKDRGGNAPDGRDGGLKVTPDNRHPPSSRKPPPRRSERGGKNDGKQAANCVWIVEPHVLEDLERAEAQRCGMSEGELTL